VNVSAHLFLCVFFPLCEGRPRTVEGKGGKGTGKVQHFETRCRERTSRSWKVREALKEGDLTLWILNVIGRSWRLNNLDL